MQFNIFIDNSEHNPSEEKSGSRPKHWSFTLGIVVAVIQDYIQHQNINFVSSYKQMNLVT